MYFAPDGHSVVYRVSSLESRHSRSTAERPEVSMVVFDSAAYVIARQRRPRTTSWRDVSTPCSGHGFRDSGSSPRLRDPEVRRLYRARISGHSIHVPGGRSEYAAGGRRDRLRGGMGGRRGAACVDAGMRACLGHQGQGDGGCRSGKGAGRAGGPRSGQSPGTGLTGCRQRQAIRLRRSHRRSGTSPVCPTGSSRSSAGSADEGRFAAQQVAEGAKDSADNVRQAGSSS